MRGRLIFAILAIAATLLLAAHQGVVAVKNTGSLAVAALFKPALAFFGSLATPAEDSLELQNLRRENELLKARLLALEKSPRLEIAGERARLEAKIYSTYPFNNRGLVAINAGSAIGSALGAPVTVGEYFLFGQVTEVTEQFSLVRTVFDSGWELPVKIGDDAIDALLVGGRDPKITLITKDKEIALGEIVYSAGRDFPYGLKIGEIREIFNDAKSAFKEAFLNLPYSPAELADVAVMVR